jgi:hypothetical protein
MVEGRGAFALVGRSDGREDVLDTYGSKVYGIFQSQPAQGMGWMIFTVGW